MIVQLNPYLQVKVVSKANQEATALFLIDYSPQDDLMFVVSMNETGEIWVVPSYNLRLHNNWTFNQ